MKKKLLLVELHQETNSFSKVPTTLKEFRGLYLSYGPEEMKVFDKKFKAQCYGFRKAVEKYGGDEFEIVPLYSAWANSGGPISIEVYQHFKDLVLDELRGRDDLSGMYFSLHGAMGVEGMHDPETDILGAIREIVGPDFPIGVSYDLHANVTEENIRLATFIHGYRTNPHRDHRKVGYRCGKLLIRIVRGEVKPVMSFRKMRLLKGGGWGIDLLQPMRGILRRMRQMERQHKDVLSVSNFWVHLWIDEEEVGWSTIVVTDDNQELGDKLAEELADRNWAVRDRKHPTPKPLDQAIRIARKARLRRRLGTVIFCDVSDVVGAGAPGENTWILKGMLEQAPELKSYIPVRCPESAAQACEAALNSTIDLEVGGRLDPEYNVMVPYRGEVIIQRETKWGKTAVVKHKGIHLILTEVAFPAYFPEDFKRVGLNLWKADVTIVKNLFPFRFRFLKYNRKTVNVVTRGITNVDVHSLKYDHIPRPIYPLDKIEDWR